MPIYDYQTSKNWLLTSPHRQLTDLEKCSMGYIKKVAYDWCVGEEGTGDEYHVHFYVRFPSESGNLFSGKNGYLPGWNVQIVRDGDEDLVLDYVKKDGSYEHLREHLPAMYADDNPEWRPWQQQALDMSSNHRQVICVVDEKGNTGKTYLAMWHAVRHRAVMLPLVKSYTDIMRAAFLQPSRMYFIDLPRADCTKKQLREVYAAVETIKNGYAFDDRYTFRKRYFDSPRVIVFANKMPDMSLLSADRWQFIYPEISYLIL